MSVVTNELESLSYCGLMPSCSEICWERVFVTWPSNVALWEINSKAYNNEQGLLVCEGQSRKVGCCTEVNT